jgi:hypothetical protein
MGSVSVVLVFLGHALRPQIQQHWVPEESQNPDPKNGQPRDLLRWGTLGLWRTMRPPPQVI